VQHRTEARGGRGEQQWECWEGIHATLRGNTGLQAFNKLPAITSSFAELAAATQHSLSRP